MRTRSRLALVFVALVAVAVPAAHAVAAAPASRQAQPQTPKPASPPQVLVPKPFPQPDQPPPPATPPPQAATAPPASAVGQPGVGKAPGTSTTSGELAKLEATLGVKIYPTADFLESFDAGKGGQRYYLFGTDAPYPDIVNYYKNVLQKGGRTLFQAPAMYQFDLANFDDKTMAFEPSVVVKDYTWLGSDGYLFVKGTTERRYRTIIQIVPVTPASGGGQ